MKYGRHLLICLSVLIFGGCGTTVHESLKVQQTGKNQIGSDKTVVILPFADYSLADDNLERAYRRQLFVNENITDQFVKYGFHLPVQDDVFSYLVDQKIIKAQTYTTSKTASLEHELKGEWCPEIKSELKRYIDLNRRQYADNESGSTRGLTKQEIVKIGRYFSADYIVRGQINQYKTRQDPSWNPMKRGILTFMSGTTSRIIFGHAESDLYDELNTTTAAGIDAAIISGITDGELTHAIAWGAGGAYLGNLAQHSGKIPQAVVQMRIWVQDAYTGNVVWTNRVNVQVSPKSVFADQQYDVLFEGATEKGIATLIDDFAQVVYHVPPPVQPSNTRFRRP
ncbi:MAG: hypothetical protein FWD79_08600 [Desulfobulbus sp.]|nr:hypothetical protein [Desulfobulbus sp.]